jgi:hypothetical protein
MKKGIVIIIALLNATLSIGQNTTSISKEKLIGSWSLVSIDNIYPDNSRVYPYGVNPKGLLIFDSNGNYAIQILKAVRSKIVSGDKNTSTAQENAALVQGNNSHFGKYEINQKNNTIAFKIEAAFFPNWEGTTQIRSCICKHNQIKYVVTQTTQGGQSVIAEVVWQKLKHI